MFFIQIIKNFFAFTSIIFLLTAQQLAFGQEFTTKAQQAIAVDYDTGKVMFTKNEDQQMTPSSMSKLMTLYVAFNKIKSGHASESDIYTVSKKAWSRGGSTMFLLEGQKVTIGDLLQGIAVVSGNDACIALAEGMFGTEELFVQEMNRIAKSIGLKNSHFTNSSGWPQEGHFMTAADLARLAIKIYQDFPEYYYIFSKKSFVYNNIGQNNSNEMLFKNSLTDGIKTGRTQSGGYGVVISAKDDARRTFIVLNGLNSSLERYQEADKLLKYTLNSFEIKTIFKKDDIIENIDVLFGKAKNLPLVVAKDLKILYKVIDKSDVKIKLIYQDAIEAPVKKGQNLGQIIVEIPEQTQTIIPLLSAYDIERVGWIKERWYKLKGFF